MNFKNQKGSIAMFVLVGLLFMTAFLLLSIGSNVNKSKIAKEQFNIISDIYSHGDGDENAYNRAYTALRKENKGILTVSVENSSAIELTKTFAQELYNIKIYGNTSKVGDLVTSIDDENYGKYKVQIKSTNGSTTNGNTANGNTANGSTTNGSTTNGSTTNENTTNGSTTEENTISVYITAQLEKTDSYVDYIDFAEKKVIRKETTGGTSVKEELSITDYNDMYEDYTKIEIITSTTPSKVEVKYYGYTL